MVFRKLQKKSFQKYHCVFGTFNVNKSTHDLVLNGKKNNTGINVLYYILNCSIPIHICITTAGIVFTQV